MEATIEAKPMRIWEHRLCPGLISTLEKIADRIRESKVNQVNIGDLGLSNSEYCNSQKLRYFGLIAHHRENGEIVRGEWVITTWGFLFLLGQLKIPVYVKTLNNHVRERYGEEVKYGDMKRRSYSEDYWQEHFQSWLVGQMKNQSELFEEAS